MKKLLALILALVCCTACFSLTACTKDVIVVGYTEYAPMNYTDDNGKLVGFDTELAEMVFDNLGYTVRFKEIVWDSRYTELNGGTIDCIWNGFTSNANDNDGSSRADKVDFSYNYMNNAQCIVRLSTAQDVTDFSQFAGKTIAFESGSAGQSFVKTNIIDEKILINEKGVTAQMDAIMNVSLGTADFAVVDVLLAQSIVGQGNYANLAINQGIAIDNEYYAIGFRKDSELTAKVNAELEKLAENGELLRLAEKYQLANAVITDFSSQKVMPLGNN